MLSFIYIQIYIFFLHFNTFNIFFGVLLFAYNYQGPHYSSHNIADCYNLLFQSTGFLFVQVTGKVRLQMLITVERCFAKRCCN